MKTYLVGGAVRDRVLGKPAQGKDWCVVGATPDEMIKRGFRQVGKDFPVFLHPETGEEYALARTERKTGPGYHGFSFDTSPDVTIEEDLLRRDLTVNAIAEDESGNIIDPYGGIADIEQRVLRHVSAAYREDPVRILRTARFYARFAADGFTIAGETLGLMAEMVAAGETAAIQVPECSGVRGGGDERAGEEAGAGRAQVGEEGERAVHPCEGLGWVGTALASSRPLPQAAASTSSPPRRPFPQEKKSKKSKKSKDGKKSKKAELPFTSQT